MTKEEKEKAIEELKLLREEYWDDDGYGHETKQYDDTMIALDMAIKALQDNSYELFKESYEVEHQRNIRLEEKIKALEQELTSKLRNKTMYSIVLKDGKIINVKANKVFWVREPGVITFYHDSDMVARINKNNIVGWIDADYKEKSCDVLDKIKVKIEQSYCKVNNDYDRGRNYGLYMATMIIDKYKAEREDNK